MITTFEREKIEEFIGSQESKINFLQEFPKVAKFNRKHSVFYTSGVFQLSDGPPILVLPWFLKDNDDLFDEKKTNSSLYEFFNIIKEIKSFMQSSVDLDNNTEVNALDIILYSYLLNLKEKIKHITSFNFHQNVSREEKSIKGKWSVAKDLSKGPRPLNFSCEYSSLEQNIPVLIFLKSFIKHLEKILKSKKNLIVLNQIASYLKDVDDIRPSKKLLYEARSWTSMNPKFDSFFTILDFAESIMFENNIYSKNAGISYHFRMDKFFENIIHTLFNQLSESQISTQTRENVLGGAIWRNNNQCIFDEDIKKANQYSIPDVIIESHDSYIVLECKYKPFRIPFINNNSVSSDLVSFGRNDRNQLLSFIMSLRPTPALSNKKVQFSVIFPCREIESYEISELTFSSAKLHIDPIVRNLVQNKNDFNENTMLKIKFIGLNVSRCIKAVLDKEIQFSEEILQRIAGKIKEAEVLIPQTRFQATLEKRLALTSVVIDKSKNDKNLGRVKLAKLFYLTDQHLNLGMDANYIREAAGPLDQRLIYNDKIGIEYLGEKYSFFKVSNNKRNSLERVKYTPSTNISYILHKAEEVFFDKLENINSLLDVLLPLDTNQSEIVATLYACWNDLLIQKGSGVSDSEIIAEFKNNWHESKKRFSDERLSGALTWMREKGIVPSGIGSQTGKKYEDIPSGF